VCCYKLGPMKLRLLSREIKTFLVLIYRKLKVDW